jgi:hypothetical protein
MAQYLCSVAWHLKKHLRDKSGNEEEDRSAEINEGSHGGREEMPPRVPHVPLMVFKVEWPTAIQPNKDKTASTHHLRRSSAPQQPRECRRELQLPVEGMHLYIEWQTSCRSQSFISTAIKSGVSESSGVQMTRYARHSGPPIRNSAQAYTRLC